MSSPDISERLRSLIHSQTTDRRRAKELEEATGVPAANWKNFWTRKQRPTSHMIETAAKRWPQFALWLATGVTDEANGHSAPDEAWGLNPSARAEKTDEGEAESYLALSLYLHFLIYGKSRALLDNQKEKTNPSEAELAKAKQESSDLARAMFGEPKVFQTKYLDINDAVDDLARQRWIDKQIATFGLDGLDEAAQIEKLTNLRRQLTEKRRKS